MNIVHFDQIDSTNSEATRGDYPHGTVITADYQTAGRGQRGNQWKSQKGENLMFSLVLEPRHIPVVEQYRISMMAALAASDALREWGVNCLIKWSNDLYVNDSKIGGILIEHSLMSAMLQQSVIGIGINVRQREFPTDLPNPTSVVNEGIENCSPRELLEKFVECFEKRYLQSAEDLHSDYMERLWRSEGEHRFADTDGEFRACIEAVDPMTGQLTLTDAAGRMREYWFKEVEFLL